MKLEREKKYLITDEQAKNLMKKSLKTIGAVQWYIDDCKLFGKSNGCRIRYTFDVSGSEEWIIATKGELMNDFTREEQEDQLSASNEIFSLLYFKPVVAKLRYFLMFQPAEVVLDEFIQLDRPYNVSVKYIVEIETDEDFEKYEKIFDLINPLCAEDFLKYTNKNIATVSKLAPQKIIEIVRIKMIESKQPW
ncbi:MAG: hypothetical protein N2Z58_07185 [Fervidobacterium sp.]|nr:hypothetical protein [Fervidobacterium sp.]